MFWYGNRFFPHFFDLPWSPRKQLDQIFRQVFWLPDRFTCHAFPFSFSTVASWRSSPVTAAGPFLSLTGFPFICSKAAPKSIVKIVGIRIRVNKKFVHSYYFKYLLSDEWTARRCAMFTSASIYWVAVKLCQVFNQASCTGIHSRIKGSCTLNIDNFSFTPGISSKQMP